MDPHIRSVGTQYESDEDFAMALLSEAAQMLETILFSEGSLLSYVLIVPDDRGQGYRILVYDKEGGNGQDSTN